MIALILNSGVGSRMGDMTKTQPKCMTDIGEGATILSRQLKQLQAAGIKKAVITTGLFNDVLMAHVASLGLEMDVQFVHNPIFRETNYIYSIHLAKEALCDDMVLLHGDLVFDDALLKQALAQPHSCMVVSSTLPLPEKDFKAVIKDGKIEKVGIAFFDSALAAQPLYKLNRADASIWLDSMDAFIKRGDVRCYAENALNEVTDRLMLYPLDAKDTLCMEIDTPEDWQLIVNKLEGK